MRRKRKTKYTWFPTIGSTIVDPSSQPTDNLSGRLFSISVPPDPSTNVLITALTLDTPQEGNDVAVSAPLVTILGNEYFLRRIVGKLFATMQGFRSAANDPSTPSAALFGAGFFIARANDFNQDNTQPIGSASLDERQENYSPLSEDTIREPWIWRRTWILSNPAFPSITTARVTNTPDAVNVANTITDFGAFPASTAGYGSVLDGPHIDAKTARRVKQDERLFFAIATTRMPVPGGDPPPTFDLAGGITGYLDFRLLGALRKAQNRGAF